MPLHLYLIRHGETTWSVTHQHTGRTDIPLTEHGEEEARQLGKRLSGTKFVQTFSSPSRRAQRTCTLVGLSQGAEIEPDLAEWNYGDYEGGCTVDIRKNHPDWNIFRDGCPGVNRPESLPPRRPAHNAPSNTGRKSRSFFARSIWMRPRRTMDWIAGEGRPPFRSRYRIAKRSRLRSRSSDSSGHFALERFFARNVRITAAPYSWRYQDPEGSGDSTMGNRCRRNP